MTILKPKQHANNPKYRLRNRALKHWALMMMLLPGIIIGLVIGSYVTYLRYSELNQNLVNRGLYLSQPLTVLAAHAIVHHDTDTLQQTINSAHRQASPVIRAISIFLPDHQLLMSSNRHPEIGNSRFKLNKSIPDITRVEVASDYIYIRSPIFNEFELELNGTTSNKPVIYGYLVVELNRFESLLSQRSTLFTVISIILMILSVSAIFAIRFIRNVMTPVTILSKTLEKIVEGDTKVRVKEEMLGELDVLRQQVNKIGNSIQTANQQAEYSIGEYTQELQQTVEQLEVQNIELNLAKREAQQASKVKSQFLANMSHELRTPLSGVLGFTRQLKKTSLNLNQRDFLDTIETSAQNLLRIINDILDFSKLDAGKMVLEKMPFSLYESINEVTTLLAPSIFDKGLLVYVSIDSKVPKSLMGDPEKLKQIITNLMGNAIKFTSTGFIRLEVSYLASTDSGHRLKFSVIDTGVGIDEESQQKLFHAFGQADESITRKFGGTGLGLIICKKLVEAMHGKIYFESQRLGEVDPSMREGAKGRSPTTESIGTQFHFEIILEESNVDVSEYSHTDVLKNKRILYMDSDLQSLADNQAVFNHCVEAHWTYCHSEADILEIISKAKYDAIIISYRVTPSTVNVLKTLISSIKPYCNNLYTVINSISPNLKEAFVGSGARACLSMPIHYRKLLDVISQPYLTQYNDVPTRPNQFTGLKALVVDDNMANLKLFNTLLNEMSVQTDNAMNGKEALQEAQTHQYDIIFMDIQMPIMDGISACQSIKDSSLNEHTPIVSVTAHAAPDEQKYMASCGFAEYLSKPIDEDILVQVLLELCPKAFTQASKADETYLLSNTNMVEESSEAGPDRHSESVPDFKQSHYLDWTLAKERAAGKHDLAIDMLKMLLDSLPTSQADIKESFEAENIESLITAIHKLHGACCYSGVPKLKSLSEFIESELKKTAKLQNVEPEVLELIDDIDNLLKESKQWQL